MDNTTLGIAEDMTGANGDMTRGKVVDRAAASLCDYVYEGLAFDYGLTHGKVITQDVYNAVARLIARGMLARYEFDQEQSMDLIQAVVNDASEAA